MCKDLSQLNDKRYLICDIFTFKNVNILGSNKVLKAGTPILYYRANPRNMLHLFTKSDESRYNFDDNSALVNINDGAFRDNIDPHVFAEGPTSEEFYTFIKDPVKSTSTRDWPVRMDSFILISAGYDGRYGTTDDICNFEPNFE